jgi:hypothetical protein
VPDLPEEQVFVDLPLTGDYRWATQWITFLWKEGMLSECNQDPMAFCPNAPISRLDSIMLMLRVMYGIEYSPPSIAGFFSDTSVRWGETKWIEAAYQLESLNPCRGTYRMRFCPYATINRGEAAAMIVHGLGLAIP